MTKEYYIKNRERILLMRKSNYLKHKDRIIANAKEWSKNNRESRKRIALKYYYKNKNNPKIIEYRRKYDRAHPKYKKYRAQKKINGGNHTIEYWQLLLNITGNKCLFYGCKNLDIEKDHIVAIHNGGNNSEDNIQPLCRHHNASKQCKTVNYLEDYLYNEYYNNDFFIQESLNQNHG
jgi:hypothetical protein